MVLERYIPGQPGNPMEQGLLDMLKEIAPGTSYADMMRLRISGGAAKQCDDTYYVAHEDGVCYSRLWNGWGRHDNAIGNFGNFLTLEAVRGQGIGHRMLEMWYKDIQSRDKRPLGLFCSAAERPAQLYFPYGFRPALTGRTYGPLYMPLGDSPQTFRDFCDMYYQPTDVLLRRPATVEWRHEIDCLLKFALLEQGLEFGMGKTVNLEGALLYAPGKAQLLFTQQGRCVGWELGGIAQLHPAYYGKEIREDRGGTVWN